MSQKLVGECKWFNSKKGFGFITPKDGSEEVFVHQSAILADGFRSLAEKEPVEYDLDKDESGRLKAINVTGPSGAPVKGAPKPRPRYYGRKGAAQGAEAGAEGAQGAPQQVQQQQGGAPRARGPRKPRQPRQQGDAAASSSSAGDASSSAAPAAAEASAQ